MASNPALTVPSSPWAVPTVKAHPRLFMSATRKARLVARWAAPPANFTGLKTGWNGDGTAMGHLIKYMATGSLTELATAYNAASTQSYNLFQTAPFMYADSAAWVLDWGYADLTPSQRSTLITKLDGNNATRETSFNGGTYVTGAVEQGFMGYILGCLATEGEAGATSRIANVRNFVQNIGAWIDEVSSGGHFWAYGERGIYLLMTFMAYAVATSNEPGIASAVQYTGNRIKTIARRLLSPGYLILTGSAGNNQGQSNGAFWTLSPECGWTASIMADCFSDPVWQWFCNNNLAGQSTKWGPLNHGITTDPTWAGFFFYNDSLVAQSPAVAGYPTCRSITLPGQVNYQGGWNLATDVRGWLWCPMSQPPYHDNPAGGHIDIWRGSDQLVVGGYNYPGRPCAWESYPATGTQVGGYSMCMSTLLVSATGSPTPDRSGSQAIAAPAGSGAAYPKSSQFGIGGSAWLSGAVTSFTDPGGGGPGEEINAIATLTNAYKNTQLTSYKRYFSYVRGADSQRGTFVGHDVFTVAAGVARIRALFYLRQKPTGMTGEVVVSGVSAAGVMTYPNQQIIVRNGASQATIQLLAPVPTVLRWVGGGNGINGAPAGAGYESYYDGADLDWKANAQQPIAQCYARIQGQGRLEYETTPGAANGSMVWIITVDDIGTTAPVYTLASIQALAPLAFPGAPPVGGPVSTYPAPPFPSNVNRVLFRLIGANFNVTSDQPLQQVGYLGKYRINKITITNPSISLTTAVGGFYTGASKTGKILVAAGQAYSALTTGSGGTLLDTTLAAGATGNLFSAGDVPILSLTTPQGATATADIEIEGTDLT